MSSGPSEFGANQADKLGRLTRRPRAGVVVTFAPRRAEGQSIMLRSPTEGGTVLDESHIQALAARRGDPLITSFYLDVDGRRYPRRTDYQPHVTDLCHSARQRAARLGNDARTAVEADLDCIRGWLDEGIDRATTRGVAVFCCARQGYFQPFLLPVPVRDQISLESGPNVAQMLAVVEDRQRSLVVLVDGRLGRLFRVELGVVEERPKVIDEPERRVDTDVELGSWERRRDEQKRRHFRRVASAVSDEVRRWHPHHVIVGGPPDDVAGLQAHLDPAVRALVVGTIAVPAAASAPQITAAIVDVIRDCERRREEALVDELHQRTGQGQRAVFGLHPVMAALAQRRVSQLLITRGFHAVGAGCPVCGHVGIDACQCPECGTPSIEVDDLVDVAIDRALAQRATVELCDADLDIPGGIGALERF